MRDSPVRSMFMRFSGLALFLMLCPTADAAPNQPNIIVILTDDHGWGDLGVQGKLPEVRTPYMDALAKDGVRLSHGYVSAPQCIPSRCGLLTGRYQERFGVDDNNNGPLPKSEKTIANYLSDAGYRCGMVGKWHLSIKIEPGAGAKKGENKVTPMPEHQPHHFGFSELFCGEMNNYLATHKLDGKLIPAGPKMVKDTGFRVDVQTQAALSFIDRSAKQPFFLYLSYFAPHVPSEAPDRYQDRFKHVQDKTRRVGLAMISAVDDGIGAIRASLAKQGIDKNTLIVFLSDNGAPTHDGAWDGSVNLPLVGEKGMLTDGGIRVPYTMCWPGKLPAGKVYDQPVSSLDILPTTLAVAGVTSKPEWKFDGVNVLPYLLGEKSGSPHERLFWRWRSQAAVREGQWKLIYLSPETYYLFDVTTPEGERGRNDQAAKQPERVADLKKKLESWASEFSPRGLPTQKADPHGAYYKDHLNRP